LPQSDSRRRRPRGPIRASDQASARRPRLASHAREVAGSSPGAPIYLSNERPAWLSPASVRQLGR
jgi:hypothetical protein